MAFEPQEPITLTNLPPFAQRMRDAADVVWEEGYRQPFIRELGAGTLPRDTFAFYLIQDELYLNDYAKVHALAFFNKGKIDNCYVRDLFIDRKSVV